MLMFYTMFLQIFLHVGIEIFTTAICLENLDSLFSNVLSPCLVFLEMVKYGGCILCPRKVTFRISAMMFNECQNISGSVDGWYTNRSNNITVDKFH